MEGKVKSRQDTGLIERTMRDISVSMEVKRELRNSIILSAVTCASETWAWNKSQ